jgi:hypothetical protein
MVGAGVWCAWRRPGGQSPVDASRPFRQVWRLGGRFLPAKILSVAPDRTTMAVSSPLHVAKSLAAPSVRPQSSKGRSAPSIFHRNRRDVPYSYGRESVYSRSRSRWTMNRITSPSTARTRPRRTFTVACGYISRAALTVRSSARGPVGAVLAFNRPPVSGCHSVLHGSNHRQRDLRPRPGSARRAGRPPRGGVGSPTSPALPRREHVGPVVDPR